MIRPWLILVTGVALVVAVVAVAVVLVAFFAALGLGDLFQPARKPLPMVTVETVYPGANPQMLADVVAAPIEQQVLGVEGMRYMMSRCDQDGRYTLRMFFEPGTDMSMAQVLVQNRTSLALPVLPEEIKRHGLTIRKDAAHPLLFVILYSPDGSLDSTYLTRYARLQMVDELARVAGVARVSIAGEQEPTLRVWLDPERLSARALTALDVVRALEQQNLRVAAPADEPFTVTMLGRLAGPEEIQEVILKAGADPIIRLKDVGRVELVADPKGSEAIFDGRSVALLAAYALPDADPTHVRAEVGERLEILRARFPAGLDVTTIFDFSSRNSGDYVTVDLDLPAGAALERTVQAAQRCEALVRQREGVAHVLCLCGPPFRDLTSEACLLVQLQPGGKRAKNRGETAAAIKALLAEEIRDALVRGRDPGGAPRRPLADYPLCLGVSGDNRETVRTQAERLRERLTRSPLLNDVHGGASTDAPQVRLEIDRTRAKALGVNEHDMLTTIQVAMGSMQVDTAQAFGRRWKLSLRVDEKAAERVEDLMQLKVRNNAGQMVPLRVMVTVRRGNEPQAIERLDAQPTLILRANLAPGVTIEQARKQIEADAADIAADCRLTWLPAN
jgi:multidrug efflux pump subunit AcrB